MIKILFLFVSASYALKVTQKNHWQSDKPVELKEKASAGAESSLSNCQKEKSKAMSFKVIDEDVAAKCKGEILPDFKVTATSGKREGHIKKEVTDEMTWKAWHHSSYHQNDFRLQQAMHRLNTEKGEFNVVVVGGSISAGRGCQLHQNWVAQLRNMLTEKYGDRVKVTNLAQSASNTQSVISAQWTIKQDVLEAADLIISEYHFNEMFGQSGKSVTKMNEKLAYMALNLPKQPAFLYLDLPGPPKNRQWQGWETYPEVSKSLHYNASKRFGVPIVWFSDVEKEIGFTLNWYIDMHPDCPTHTVFAKVIHDVLQQTQMGVCMHGVQGTDTVLPKVANDQWKKCVENQKHALTAHASLGQKSFPVKSAGEWAFQEDVAGKPGWIASTGSKKEIVFTKIPVKIGGLSFQYLRTYNDAGSVTCSLEKEGEQIKSMTLHGLWQECVSLEMTAEFFDIPEGEYDLRCQSDGAKFKLLGLQTC